MKLRNVPILILLLILLSGCTLTAADSEDRIGSPENLESPVTGTWQLGDCLTGGEKTDPAPMAEDPMIGASISFSADRIVFANDVYDNISYKIKRVKLHEYFLHKNSGIPENMNFASNEAFIITVYSDDNFLMEFVSNHEGDIMAAIDDRYYCMEKISDGFADAAVTVEETVNQAETEDARGKKQILRSGVLLGVRIPVETDDGLGDYTYGTYFISSVDRVLRPVLYANDIYLPRMDGFWKVRVDKSMGWKGLEDTLMAAKVSSTQRSMLSGAFENSSKRIETSTRKAIMYIGNDYVCVENTFYDLQSDPVQANTEKTLRTLPIDNIANIDGITISDLAGENGRMAMESAIDELLENSGYSRTVGTDTQAQEKNFSLYRKTGHWFLKGRIDPDQQEQLPYIDFNLNLLPPSNMVAYDVLQIPWTEMKDKLPHATDIYTSPNDDMAIILTHNEILVYLIADNKLGEEPIASFRLEKGSSVIMAEWCMDDYVQSWEKSFSKNNTVATVQKIEAEIKE